MDLQEACELVERELKAIRAVEVSIEYSDGVSIWHPGGVSSRVNLFESLSAAKYKMSSRLVDAR